MMPTCRSKRLCQRCLQTVSENYNAFHLQYFNNNNNNNNNNNIFTAIGLSPGGSVYFTCIQNMKLVTNKFKSGGLHEKHVVATWNVGNRLSVCL